ncbi:MAG: carboxypeptidase regulatory-like domain-containing protein, partial [Candidatus Nanohaloarchaea archaeon]
EAELTVNVENQDGDELDAQVSMDNGESYTGFTGSDGEKTFTVKPGDYEVTASKHDYTTETREISLEDGEEKNVTITLEQLEDSNTANLEVIVENENGERLEDASVAVENGDSKTDSTDSDGESRFSLEPGDYTISVSKPGYSSKDKTIELEEGDSETEVFTLGEQGEKAIEIQSISYPDTVCRGQSFTADVTIQNQGGFHEMVTLTGTGLGSINIGERFSLDQNAEKTSELVFTDVQGSGTEEFEVTATNHDTDKETRTINVKSCVTTTPQKEQARGITMSVEPQEVVVGNSVHVKGYVNGIKGSANVEIRLNGERKARVATQPDGFYEVYLKPGEVGDATISATTKGASASRTIKVVPTATVDSVEAPRKVFEGKKFEVCTSVYSQVTPKVYLIRNNKVLKTKNQAGDVCFQTKAYETGTQKFTVKALAGGRGNSAYTTVEVLPMRSEVSSFSDQVASVESEEGLIKVELYNTHDELRRYHLSLEGLPSTWQGQSQKEAVLNTGESETVYFYLTPQEAGDRDPVVKVETDGNTIYRQKIDLVTGGIKEPREQGFLSSLADLLPF